MSKQKKSLFGKLLMMNIAVVAAAIMIIALLLPRLISGYIFTQKERELTAKGEELARLTTSYHSGAINEETFLEMLESLDHFLEARIWVVDHDGVVVRASYGTRPFRRGPHLMLSQEHLKQLHEGENVVARRYLQHFEQVMLTVGVPISGGQGQEAAGAIFLHAPVTDINATVNSLIRFVLLSGAIAVGLASILGYFFSIRLTQPLQEMTRAAKAMGRGQYSNRVSIDSEDELGQLGHSLNSLAGRLEKTITALEGEKSKFQSMVSGMLEGVVGVNSRGELIYFNTPGRQMLQLKDSALGAVVESAFPSAEFAEPFLKTLQEGKPNSALVNDNGNYYSIRVSPVETDSAEAPGAVGLIQDVSEGERLEKMRRDFIANVSHELRTPLTVIRGYAEALLDGTANPDQRARYLQIINSESQVLNGLITDILDLSRLQDGCLKLHKKTFELSSLAQELIIRLQPYLEEKELDLKIDIPAPLKVWADQGRIQQVLANLVENAVRYSPAGGSIYISAATTGGKAQVSVRDEGPGISEGELSRIFERFYRVEKSRDRKEGGTGLGLAIVKEIIQAHGESIIAESPPGQGASFIFNLPLPSTTTD